MASKLSGTSSTSFHYVRSNIGQLTIASVLPVVLLLAGNVVYVLLGIDTALNASTGGAGEAGNAPALLYVIAALAFGLFGLFVYCWLVAKVSKLYLTGEPASVIGSGGTLRAGFWIALYYVAVTLIIFIPLLIGLFVVVFVGSSVIGGDPESGNAGAIVLAVLGVIAFGVLVGWAECRFVVGFPPLALGERVGLFDGWRISKGNSLGLFGRVVAASLLWFVVVVVVMVIVFFVMSSLLGGSLADPSGAAFQLAGYALLVQQILFIFLALPFYWYLAVLFCEAYRRLSAG